MVNGAPQITGFTGDFHKHLIDMLVPLGDVTHGARSLFSDVRGGHCAKPIDP